MKDTRFYRVGLVVVLVGIMLIAGVMGYALTENPTKKTTGDQGEASTQTLLQLLTRPFQNLGKDDPEQAQDTVKMIQEGNAPKAYVVSYGTTERKDLCSSKGVFIAYFKTSIVFKKLTVILAVAPQSNSPS